ncbi:MECR [Lepeophtheirus salmonis]|uniref:Enoyl-[acyl-carrier-protein] reductase, mitochondrial n=1 Tax=Lepeophtheirus salmonis TaxID=72036 RepID=A0A7R8HE84_LEPSM|nr:MECR [Lepeophtheirus salmonis]CAF3040007.1 MECR [Lepeophtheirus salmonis]
MRRISKITFNEFGLPSEVLKYSKSSEQQDVVRDPSSEIRVKNEVCPCVYPTKPDTFPAVPGGEGLGEVVEAPSSSSFSVGDWVFPTNRKHGTWRTDLVANELDLIKIRNDIDPISAATLKINPSTAYLMLKFFVNLQPGDTIIQNGANSGVGRSVIQIAKCMNVKTVNIVRKREYLLDLKDELIDLGADYVLTEEELRATQLFKSMEITKPKLALNCVGGSSSAELAKTLSFKGKHVTYDISFHGFWLSRWFEEHSREEASTMLNFLAGLVHSNQLRAPPYKLLPLKDFEEAVSLKGFRNAKYILDMSNE